jgi:hypothetical protein
MRRLSAGCRHVERAVRGPGARPANGDRPGTRVELHALGSVGVEVAKERLFPAAEREKRHRVMMRARRSGAVARHAGSADAADRTARSTSTRLAKGTNRTTWPVAAHVTSPRRPPSALTGFPAIQSGTDSTAPAAPDEAFTDVAFMVLKKSWKTRSRGSGHPRPRRLQRIRRAHRAPRPARRR